MVKRLNPGETLNSAVSPGSSDLVDAVRFGMDYVYAAASFGRHAVEDAAARVSAASPVPEAAALRMMLKPHRCSWGGTTCDDHPGYVKKVGG